MKTRIFIAIALLLAAAIGWGATTLSAQGRSHHRMDVAEALELTAEQKESIKTMRLNQAKQMTRLQADLKIARMDLHALMDQDEPKVDAVKAKVAEIGRIQTQILEKQTDFKLGLHRVLTPEQREKMKSMPKHGWKRRHMEHRRGPWRGHGPGPRWEGEAPGPGPSKPMPGGQGSEE